MRISKTAGLLGLALAAALAAAPASAAAGPPARPADGRAPLGQKIPWTPAQPMAAWTPYRAPAGPPAARQPAGRRAALPPMRAACGPVHSLTVARCFALYRPQVRVNAALAAQAAGKPVPPGATTPKGWGPPGIQAAYKLPVTRDPHQTIAIVGAFSAPHLAHDLAFYRQHYGLPPCTVASGCLRVVNQAGQAGPLPAPDPFGWGVEETLDVSMVSAACPHCRILLVEADTPTGANLAAAADTAVRLGAAVISNSYGLRESGFDAPWAHAYHHPGHVIVASSGDTGFTAAQFPANQASVTAVGGTILAHAQGTARGYRERAWNITFAGATGSGCSAYVAKPAWQHDTHCPQGRMTADVAAVAWNLAIYDSSFLPNDGGPWLEAAGTSASAPLVAGVYGLAGNAATVRSGGEYAHPGALFDVTKGTNVPSGGQGCGGDYLCNAKPGYDGPTGLGTPNGTGAF